jgi:hypothetical protein
MIIQCENEEQYDLLSRQALTLPLGNLQIDIDEDSISPEIQQEFLALATDGGKEE